MKKPELKQAAATPHPFHAVEIEPIGKACQAAKLLTGIRFLSNGKPPIVPLADCDRRATCRCRYRHHEDRRSDARRGSDQPWAPTIPWSGPTERRKTRGRRATD
jgi:hypothetical protein